MTMLRNLCYCPKCEIVGKSEFAYTHKRGLSLYHICYFQLELDTRVSSLLKWNYMSEKEMGYDNIMDETGRYYPDVLERELVDLDICPKCKGEAYTIDEHFIPIAFLVGRAGITTRFSCSGHLWEFENHSDSGNLYFVADAGEYEFFNYFRNYNKNGVRIYLEGKEKYREDIIVLRSVSENSPNDAYEAVMDYFRERYRG